MQKTSRTMKLLAAVAAAALVATGCATVSDNVADNGESAQKILWPKLDSTNATHKGGTFPNIQSLKLVQAGMNKQQIQALIGAPQYGEGIGVREWDYLLNFRGKDGAVTQCQYKILFDTKKLARSFYWNPEGCAAPFLNPVAEAPKPEVKRMTLSADALFGFDRYTLGSINPKGRTELNQVAADLNSDEWKDAPVSVVGYTDRLGSDAYNMHLSQQRADTVRSYLVQHGVAESRITAEGMGKADPVVQCHESKRSELIACLAPNRRVVVEVKR